MILENEFLEKLKNDGEDGFGSCNLVMSFGGNDIEEGLIINIGACSISCKRIKENYVLDITFKDLLNLKKCLNTLEKYGTYLELDGDELSENHCLYIELFENDTLYIDNYLVFMNPIFWALTALDYGEPTNVVRLLINENNKAFVSLDDISEE